MEVFRPLNVHAASNSPHRLINMTWVPSWDTLICRVTDHMNIVTREIWPKTEARSF